MSATRAQWWETRRFAALAIALAAVPLLWPTIPPLTDLLGHLGRYRVELDGAHHAWLSDWYAFHWALIGNLGVDLLIVPFAKVFGLELGVKLIVIAIPMLTVSGLLWIAREVHGRVPPTALFALPLAYSFPFHFGFVNFALSMALTLNAFALWLRLARLNRTGLRAAIFAPLSCLLWLCHAYGWGVLGLLAGAAELVRQRDASGSWIKAIPRVLLSCIPLCLPVLLMALWRSGDVGGESGDWFNWQAKISWLTMILRDRWQAFDIAATSILFIVLFKGWRDPELEYSRTLGLAASLLLAAFVLSPRILLGSAYADMRIAPFMVAIGLIAIRPRAAADPRRARPLALAGLAFLLTLTGATTLSLGLYGQRIDRALAALDHVPRGARMVSFVTQPCAPDWFTARLDHVPALALVRRLAYSNDQWSVAGAQLLTTHYPGAPGYSHDPSQIVMDSACPDRPELRTLDAALATFPRDHFNYVWLIAPPPLGAARTFGLRPVWSDGRDFLFAIPHPRLSPPHPAP